MVHWYFATKDDLFVAVLDALQSADLEEAKARLSRSAPGQREEDLGTLLMEFVWRRLNRYIPTDMDELLVSTMRNCAKAELGMDRNPTRSRGAPPR